MSITNKEGTYNKHLDSLHQNTDKLHQTNSTMAMTKDMNCFKFYSDVHKEKRLIPELAQSIHCV